MTKPTPPPTQIITQHNSSQPKLQFNWEDWLPYLEDSTASPEQKRALIEALGSIVQSFVDLGWGLTTETCGESFDLKAALEAAVVNSEKQETIGDTEGTT